MSTGRGIDVANGPSGGMGDTSWALPATRRSAAGPREAARWDRGQIIATELRAIRGRSYPRIRAMFRERSWIFFEIALTLEGFGVTGVAGRVGDQHATGGLGRRCGERARA